LENAMQKKWHEYVGIRAALIITAGGIIVAAMNICSSRSQLAQDNATLRTENNAYIETIRDRETTIADLNQRISQKDSELQRLQADFIPFKTVALEKYTGSEEERLRKLADEIQKLNNPLTKLIASATSYVEVTIKSDRTQGSATIEGSGGGHLIALMFVKDRQPLLATGGTQLNVRWTGKGEAT
jgi:hypothetical protein